jgi:hypothetical protein
MKLIVALAVTQFTCPTGLDGNKQGYPARYMRHDGLAT